MHYRDRYQDLKIRMIRHKKPEKKQLLQKTEKQGRQVHNRGGQRQKLHDILHLLFLLSAFRLLAVTTEQQKSNEYNQLG